MADEQLDIFGGATPFAELESRTSRAGGRGGSAAAASIPDDHQRYYEILSVIDLHVRIHDYSLADWELGKRLPTIHPGTLSKRRLRLERAGLVEEVKGVMHTTPFGVEAMTFTITDKGREVLRQWQSQHPTSNGSPLPPSGSTSPSSTS